MPIKNPTKLRKWSSVIIALLIACAGIVMIYITNSITITSKAELTEIQGELLWIKPEITKGCSSYDMRLGIYSNEFKIAADYDGLFGFQRLLDDNSGKLDLKLLIRKTDVPKLNSKEHVKVYGLKSIGKPYLDVEDVLTSDADSRSQAPYIAGLMFLLAIGIYVFRRYFYKSDF